METELEHILTSTYKDGMVSYMEAHPAAFEEAVKLALSNNHPYSWRAAWLLKSCIEKNDPRLQKEVKNIIRALKTAGQSSQRELLLILLKMEISAKYEGRVFDLCITIWEDITKQPSVRCVAFRLIVKMVKQHPELKHEINYLIQERFITPLTPGAKHSISKIIKSLGL
jgi:hypothetical protein